MTRPAKRRHSRSRVIALSVVLAAVAAVALVRSSMTVTGPAPFIIPWWGFVPVFVLTEALIFHIEVRNEAHSFSLSELPLVLGLFFAAPWSVVVGRVVGHLIFLGLVRRQALLKLAFNLSLFAAETAVAIYFFRLISGGADPTRPLSWLAIFAGVLIADTLSMFAVTAAIRWHGGHTKFSSVLQTGGLTAVVNTSLSVVAVILLWVSPWAMAFFVMIAVTVALAYRGYAGLAQRLASLQLLYDFTRMVGSSVRAEAVMDNVLAEARNLLRAARAEVILLEAGPGASGHRLVNQDAAPDDVLPAEPADLAGLEGEWVWRQVVVERRPVVIPRTTRDGNRQSFLEKLNLRDCIVAPLLSEGEVVGTIMVANRTSEVSTFDDDDLQLFATLANHASVAFQNGRLMDQLRKEAEERRYEALHDSLTGLANRSLFLQKVAEMGSHAGDGGRELAGVLLMDLDRFKEVNDTLGHHSGDRLLCEVAARLNSALRREDTISRLGGDEFAILLRHLDSVEQAVATAARIAQDLERPFALDDISVDVGVSIGIAISPDHGTDASSLLQRADIAMYQAKTMNKGAVLYSPESDDHSTKRLALAADLRRALGEGELIVYHQPKARLCDGVVTGTEALVRWRHPQHGLIGPDEFIPVAEKTGLISPLTLLVLGKALDQCQLWRQAGYEMGVSVNLAVRSLLDADLTDHVSAALEAADVPPSALTLEITESGVMADPTRTITVLEELAASGVRISVDDFGTGYSSLSYLRRLPVHEVKVDRTFVFRLASDASDASIVQSIVELGHNLGLKTVAEGVEDQLSWDMLRSLGCDEAQGYFLSRPVPASTITDWLTRRSYTAGGAPVGPVEGWRLVAPARR